MYRLHTLRFSCFFWTIFLCLMYLWCACVIFEWLWSQKLNMANICFSNISFGRLICLWCACMMFEWLESQKLNMANICFFNISFWRLICLWCACMMFEWLESKKMNMSNICFFNHQLLALNLFVVCMHDVWMAWEPKAEHGKHLFF